MGSLFVPCGFLAGRREGGAGPVGEEVYVLRGENRKGPESGGFMSKVAKQTPPSKVSCLTSAELPPCCSLHNSSVRGAGARELAERAASGEGGRFVQRERETHKAEEKLPQQVLIWAK